MSEEDIGVLVEMYNDLERRYTQARLSTDYLKATAGVELFDTDFSGLTPDIPYVLSSLAKAEQILVRRLSGQPEERMTPLKFMRGRLVNVINEYMVHRVQQERYKST